MRVLGHPYKTQLDAFSQSLDEIRVTLDLCGSCEGMIVPRKQDKKRCEPTV